MLLVLGAIGLTYNKMKLVHCSSHAWAGENPFANELVVVTLFLGNPLLLLLFQTVYITFVTVQQTCSTLSLPITCL